MKKYRLFEMDNKIAIKNFIKNKEFFNIIYADPPYNTGLSTLTYKDKFNQTEWEDMIKDTFLNVPNIMDKDSLLFVSIGTEELAELKIILDQIFKKKNFVALMPRISNETSKTTKLISKQNDWLLIYKKGNPSMKGNSYDLSGYKFSDQHFDNRGMYQLRRLAYKDFHYSKKMDHPVTFNKNIYFPGGDREMFEKRKNTPRDKDWCWLWKKERIEFAIKNDFIIKKGLHLYKKTYENEEIKYINNEYKISKISRTKPISSLEFTEKYFKKNKWNKIKSSEFTYPKYDAFIEAILEQPVFNKKRVLDLYAGSGVTMITASKIGLNDVTLIQLNENDSAGESVADITVKNIESHGIKFKRIKKGDL